MSLDPRASFWATIQGKRVPDAELIKLEARLVRGFGPAVRRALLNELSEPLRTLDSELVRPFRHSDEMLLSFLHRRGDGDAYPFMEAVSRLSEQRQQAIRESPELRDAQERLAAAATVMFATRIGPYTSLNLDLSVSSIPQLAKAFGGEFESFRVFLDAFVPVVFVPLFSQDATDRLEYSVRIPDTVKQHFRSGTAASAMPAAQSASVPQPAVSNPGARERAEWLWRLANGSLIVPVLLALFVMYQGLKMLSDIRGTQYEAMRPILEHQLKLLEEDRQRLLRDAPPSSSAQPSSSPPRQHEQ